ncbi:unnamed protein product [Phyllotreta striolata]|uniref:Uncharacterized protein n=1 Tax=Phyllotreta striolata TaxID=444603 RepID=A0A9N9TLH3_PHYSR|nr:unnamed protein product [Phyllotreta striolata]
MGKQLYFFVAISVLLFVEIAENAPLEGANQVGNDSEAKSAFGQPFDEIVVDTSLIVKKKNPNRQSRNKSNATEPITASRLRFQQ